jgi:hypothetical protein
MPDPTAPSLDVHEWEAWHTYTTYFLVPAVDLNFAAQRLVESGIAVCAILRDGRTYWRSGATVGSGTAIIDRDPWADEAKFGFRPDADCHIALDGFALECWGQACKFRFSELRLFGQDWHLPPPYVRAFLGLCNLISEEEPKRAVRLYPVLLIYESGVVLLELRTISPSFPMPLDRFISEAVNLFRHLFDRIEAAPGLSMAATHSYYHSKPRMSFGQRAALLWLLRRHQSAVHRLTRSDKVGDFTFELAPLGSGDDSRPCENLETFALTLFHTVAFLLGRPRIGLAFLVRGQKRTPKLGGYWSGRPHVYLTRFEGQCKTASENESRHKKAFAEILFRVHGPTSTDAEQLLPKSSRLFEDYNAYITSAISLWVWSKEGLERQRVWADPNRGHLIYEHQAVVELLEYGYMLHRAYLEQVERHGSSDEVILAQRALIHLQLEMNEASYFGEIRDLLDRGWRELKLPELRELIQETLKLRETQIRASDERLTARIGQALTIVFGLVAVPALADQVVQPLWEVLGITHPGGAAWFKIAADAVSLSFVMVVVALLMKWLGVNRPKDSN